MKILKPTLVLFMITFIAGLVLGGANAVTKEDIILQKEKALNTSLEEIFSSDDEFNLLDTTGNEGIVSCYEVTNNGDIIGYVVETSPTGYNDKITLLTGINNDNTIKKIAIVGHSETPGLGANAEKVAFTEQYINKSGEIVVVKHGAKDMEIDAITSATVTSNAVTEGVNASLKYILELKGNQ